MSDTATEYSTRTPRLRSVFVSAVVALTAVALFVEPVARQELSDGRTVDFGPLQLKLAYNSGGRVQHG